MSGSSSATPDPRHPFELDDYHGELSAPEPLPDLERQIRRLIDPAQARGTLSAGRNYLYVTDLELTEGPVEVLVKRFDERGRVARLRQRRRGSKAYRNWRTALHLIANGVETPRPLVWIESSLPDGPSYYVSELVSGFFEVRTLVRALNAGTAEREFPDVDPLSLFSELGGYLRRLHEARVWHRDLSIGNVLVFHDGGELQGFQVVDLNRARLNVRMRLYRRSLDLCRLPVRWPAIRRAFLEGYWREPVPALGLRSLTYRFLVSRHLGWHWLKNNVRTPVRSAFRGLRGRSAHPHIPEAPAGASSRDKVVWDELSDQPHQHASPLEKARLRLADLGQHARSALHTVAALPRIRRRYVELRDRRYSAPVDWGHVGVALRPWPDDPSAPVELLNDLGVEYALVRLHPWQESHAAELELVRELHSHGYDVSFSLPQSRELVRDLGRWRDGVARLAELFLPYGGTFQIGQAINRSKWGVWTYKEYLDLAAAAAEVLRGAAEVTLLGPAVIDFEPHATAGVLNLPHEGVHFDAAAHLLYVDRRGAPENPQLGFDTVDKLTLLHAIAGTSRRCEARSWITEFNWPLPQGPHSPAGREVVVDEETQADYLVRYYLLALCSGLVERVYWWQLIARGYGLVAPGEGETLRRRPAFVALGVMTAQLAGSRFVRPLPSGGDSRLYLFEREGRDLVVAWSVAGTVSARLPRAAVAVVGRDGETLGSTAGAAVELRPSPVYYDLGPTEVD